MQCPRSLPGRRDVSSLFSQEVSSNKMTHITLCTTPHHKSSIKVRTPPLTPLTPTSSTPQLRSLTSPHNTARREPPHRTHRGSQLGKTGSSKRGPAAQPPAASSHWLLLRNCKVQLLMMLSRGKSLYNHGVYQLSASCPVNPHLGAIFICLFKLLYKCTVQLFLITHGKLLCNCTILLWTMSHGKPLSCSLWGQAVLIYHAT
jgi:hypothetical protein